MLMEVSMNTVYAVKVTWCDGIDHSSWVQSIWSTREKAEQAIVRYMELDEEVFEFNCTYEVVEWEVG